MSTSPANSAISINLPSRDKKDLQTFSAKRAAGVKGCLKLFQECIFLFPYFVAVVEILVVVAARSSGVLDACGGEIWR